jgi:GR25 family glycosyltransferase involved in LPS biosynthesis
MSTSDLTLPLDPTGSASSNLILAEPHAIGPTGTRAFPLNYGLFFRDSVSVVDVATGATLVEGTQYYPTQMDLDSSLMYGQEVDAVIIIVDTTVSANVKVTYQALGGVTSLNSQVAQTAITGLDLNDSATCWANVTNKPTVYPPGPHYHQSGDVFGMEYIVSAIRRLAAAITEGQGAAQAELLQYAEDVVAEMQGIINTGEATLQAHFTCFANPHKTTAAQIGAYTTEQTVTAIAAETTARMAADSTINTNLTTHEANQANPHQLTPAQVGGFTKAQSDAAMAAMSTAVLTNIQANESTQNSHITNYNNPHQVTAAQIGTWTVSQITAAISASTGTIQNQVNAYEAALDAHLTNTSNPHKDTVANVGTWTQTAIQAGIVNPYTSHVANTGNPHQDVYSNIVTSNVDSSGVYSAATMSNSISSAYNSIASQINSLNSTTASHTGNYSNPHGDTVYNTGGAYTPAQLSYAISLLQPPGGSANNAINYLASIVN